MIYNSFTEMPVWQKSHKLAIEVFNLTINLPRSEDYGLISQIRKSANGVAACIAEGLNLNLNLNLNLSLNLSLNPFAVKIQL